MADDIRRLLAGGIQPLYTVFGDEPLLALEAADAIRAAARSAGFAEREVLTAESGFDWDALESSGSSLSLFGGGRFVELRIPTGKPGTVGAAAIQKYCARLADDAVTLVLLPGVDRKTQAAAWFQSLATAGRVIQVRPVSRDRLPRWIGERLGQQEQRADGETLEFLADRVEGNLLAADQEVKKLALLHPPGRITLESARAAVTDVARFDVFQLSDALVAGDLARFVRVVDGLKSAGEAPALVLWALARDVEALALVKSNPRPAPDAARALGLWESRRAAFDKTAKRVSANALSAAVLMCAELDRQSKGMHDGDPWEGFVLLAETLWDAGIKAERKIKDNRTTVESRHGQH